MGRGSRVILALAFILPAISVHAEEFYGPLRIRDMGPFRILRLDMMPDHAIAPSAGRWALELHVSQSNTFAMDEDTLGYLRQRGRRGEISADDVENIRGLADNAYLFDGALGYFQLGAHYGVNDNWSVYAALPVHYFGGGFLDQTIEDFHDTFGFDTFGREYVSRNDFQAVAIMDGEVYAQFDRPTSGGIGDPVLGARYWYPLDATSALSLDFAHKFAVQDVERSLSSGASDTGLQVSWHNRGLKNAFYVSASVVHAGRAAPFPERVRRNVPALNLAWEYRLGDETNLIMQLNASRSVFNTGGADEELTGNAYQASIGLRHRVEQFVWSYALTENLVNFNNTADLGFHVGFAWISKP